MNTILAGLGVYFIITTAQKYTTFPRWTWPFFTLLFAVGAMAALDSPWWTALSIAGISTLANGLEALLLTMTDRAILDISRPPPRR